MSIGMTAIVVGIGFLIGGASGLIGIGGGILIIPVLMIGFGFTQERANGTSLAMMLPPIGVLAVITYARAGNVDWRFAVLMAIGFLVGAAVGGTIVNRQWINPTALRVTFAILLLYVGSRTLFRAGGQAPRGDRYDHPHRHVHITLRHREIAGPPLGKSARPLGCRLSLPPSHRLGNGL